jgi:hypothetical protein
MADLTAQRTLVKSPPELWSEVSESESLVKHLGELGEIKITKVEPEKAVAWEGELVSGTVELEQSGWGTKVTFSVTVPEPEAAEPDPEPEPVEAAGPVAEEPPAPEPKVGFWARLFGKRQAAAPEPEPEPVPEPVPEPELELVEPEPEPLPGDPAVGPERVQEILESTLEALGQAHHRPFSRG